MIQRKYFDDHRVVFPDPVEELKRQLDFCYCLASWFNWDFSFLRRWDGMAIDKGTEARDGLDRIFKREGPIDLEALEQAIKPLIPKKAEEIVDWGMNALHNCWGERKEAKALVAKHREDVSPFEKYWKRRGA